MKNLKSDDYVNTIVVIDRKIVRMLNYEAKTTIADDFDQEISLSLLVLFGPI